MTNTNFLIWPSTILTLTLTVSVSLLSIHLKDIFTAASLANQAIKVVDNSSQRLGSTGVTSSHDVGVDLHSHVDKQTSRSILHATDAGSLQADARSLQRTSRSESKKISKRQSYIGGWQYFLHTLAAQLS